MISRKLLVSNVAVVVLAVVGVLYTSLVLLDINPFEDKVRIEVELAATGGLFDKSEVTYRGKKVGSIEELSPRPGGMTAVVALDEGVQIPKGTRVVIGGLSPVGEQTLDFRPRSDEAPYLADGDVVPESATTLPTPFSTLVLNLSNLIEQVNPRHLHTVVDEMYQGFRDTGPLLRRVISDSRTVIAALNDVAPETKVLLEDGGTVLETFDYLSSDLDSFSQDARRLTHRLRRGEPIFRSMLADLPESFTAILRDANELAPSAITLMGDTAAALGVLANRLPALEEFLRTIPLGTAAVSDAIYNGGLNAIGDILPSNLCSYHAPVATPWVRHDNEPDLGRHCREYAPDLQQRGSYNAPR